ncbi:TPA: hypothetical protein JG825_005239 [Vibrio parahaemolyticus]|uniref:phage protease n=1 Tax=Vibrio TaxID=662 RepID=UPI0020618AE5|nr:phage protease [Vibrio parahaemolyticus]UPR17286.1 hypothetical protein H9J99_21105 [Vibrio parahaemolyticus]UPR23270.1 hypothetical protein H9J98_18130 [Vibrio parahaemolyticus]HAV1517118.1 hypothetical protein [Vibrio parahaemolyticus]HAV1521821.1 hypothetical protein [Vibrio parahaemolyticus]HAV1536082.1 hypothetical protein [Vibrio parahaemolyticus]
MKKNPVTVAVNVALLNASAFAGFATLSASLDVEDDGWYQLLPAGKFKARDGRPHDTEDGYWHLDAESAAALIAATKSTSDKVLIDYEHATLRAKETGAPAPAAAWLSSSDIEWREGKGLYIRPSWTEKAKYHIDAKEYAFLSAVFPYDKSGRPLLLRMAAITNDPGLVGLEPIAELAADFNLSFYHQNGSINLYGQTEDSLVNELLKKLLAKVGIDVPESGELTQEQQTAALSAIDALKTKADTAESLQTQVAELSARDGVDLTKFVPVETYNALVGQVAVLSATSSEMSLEKVIADAKAEGKVIEAETDYLTQFGQQQGVAALSAMLEKRPAIAALTAKQTKTQTPPTDHQKKDGELSQEELAVLSATGLTQEQYLAAKEG